MYERVVSPLAGVFVMTWVIIHYDLIMMLMSKNDMMYKMQVIYECMVIDAKYNWGIGSLPAFSITARAKNELQEIKMKYDKIRPIPYENLWKLNMNIIMRGRILEKIH